MGSTNNPSWYGLRYPTWDDLISCADAVGCLVRFAKVGDQALFIAGERDEPPVIILQDDRGLLGHWLLAHELGHLMQHAGYINRRTWDRQEAQANRWAACALIPEARILGYRNASLDAFIGALSAHYEDILLDAYPLRELAAHIATIRLRALKEVA